MILDIGSKKAIMLNPKTGTMTISKIFAKYSNLRVVHEHTKLSTLQDKVLEDYANYKVYSFYRNPIDRFISGFNYSKSGRIASVTNYMALLYRDKKVPLFTNLHTKTIDELRESIQDLTISEFLSPKDHRIQDCMMQMDSSFLFEKQVSFCNHPNITLLDFDNYEDNVRLLLNEFGLDSTIEIPHLNIVDKDEHSLLTSVDIDKIKQVYKDDYEFFKSVNITF